MHKKKYTIKETSNVFLERKLKKQVPTKIYSVGKGVLLVES